MSLERDRLLAGVRAAAAASTSSSSQPIILDPDERALISLARDLETLASNELARWKSGKTFMAAREIVLRLLIATESMPMPTLTERAFKFGFDTALGDETIEAAFRDGSGSGPPFAVERYARFCEQFELMRDFARAIYKI